MPIGPGKYDDLTTHVRVQSKALGVIVIVFEGEHGSGFSVQAPLDITLKLPGLLRTVAADIEASMRRGKI